MSFKIKDICDINRDNLNKKDDLKYINYLDTSNLTLGNINELQKLIVGEDKIPSRAKRKVKVSDILISTVRPNQKHYGILKKVEDNMIVSTGFAVLTPNENIVNPSYLYNYLTQNEITEYLQGIAETSTTAYPSIKPSDIGNLEIDLPPIEEQKAIAKILSDIDDKIETNNKINKRLEEMASSIFKHWFVDFEFPNEEGKPYKSSGGEMVESELGMIPKGWEVVKLGEVLEKIIDNRGKTPKTEPSGYRLIEGFSINMGDSFVDKPTEKQKYVNEEIYKTWFRAGHPMHLDILCATVGTLPKWCFANRKENICIAQNIIAIRTNKEICSQYYLKLYMDTREFIGAFNGRVVTTAQPSIKVGHMEGIKILLPDKEIIDRLDSIVKSMYSKIEENYQEINTLINLRNTLLPKLMSGEIRVPINK